MLFKLGRMIYNEKRQVSFEYELNWFMRTEVTENLYIYFFLLGPLKIFFWYYFPFYIIGEVKRNKLLKKNLKNGEGQVCVLLNIPISSSHWVRELKHCDKWFCFRFLSDKISQCCHNGLRDTAIWKIKDFSKICWFLPIFF